MFYFKDGQVSPATIDAQQLLKVQQFKKELGDLGGLYWSYGTSDEFVNLARIHLSKQILAWRKGRGGHKTLEIPEGSANSTPQGASVLAPELGYLELFEVFEESFGSMNDVLSRLTSAVEALGQKTQERTDELNRGQSLDMSSRMRHAKRVADAMAGDMQSFSKKTEIDIPLLGKRYREATTAIARAITMSGEFSKDGKAEITVVMTQMRSLGQTLDRGSELTRSFRNSVKNTPRATSTLIAARDRVLTVLDNLDTEYQAVIQHTSELVGGLDALVQETTLPTIDGI